MKKKFYLLFHNFNLYKDFPGKSRVNILRLHYNNLTYTFVNSNIIKIWERSLH